MELDANDVIGALRQRNEALAYENTLLSVRIKNLEEKLARQAESEYVPKDDEG